MKQSEQHERTRSSPCKEEAMEPMRKQEKIHISARDTAEAVICVCMMADELMVCFRKLPVLTFDVS